MNAAAFREAYDQAKPLQVSWPTPDMTILSGGRSAPPSMPTAIFGELWPLISDLAEGAGAPVDYIAMGLLSSAASLIGGKRRVQPFHTDDWSEPCILWIAVVGDPSSNKSPAIDAATGPLRRMEADHAAGHRAVLQDFEARAERARAERKAWEDRVKAAVKDGGETPAMPDLAVEPDAPARRRLLVMDATPEAVGAILAGNPAGTLHLRDELAGWLMSFDRYSPGGREFWLEAFGGRPHVIDRKGSAKPISIPFNGVSVLGGIQPEKLTACLLGGADDGLTARFLWAWPDPVPYRRPSNIADKALLERVYRRLDELPWSFGPYGEEVPRTLRLSDQAADVFEAWVRENAAAVREASSLYKGFCGKLQGMVLRLALVAELMTWAAKDHQSEPLQISVETIVAVLDFVELYAKPAALRVFGDAALPPVERNAAALARHILKNKFDRFNLREHVERASRVPSALKERSQLDEAVNHLLEADWIRAAPSRAGSSPGRARRDFIVNPGIYGATDE